MKKIILTLTLVLILIFTCSCTQIPKEAYVICPQCGIDIEVYTDGGEYPLNYEADDLLCQDCVGAELSEEFVFIDRDDWQKIMDKHSDTEIYAEIESVIQ